jgi:hypothetical protein
MFAWAYDIPTERLATLFSGGAVGLMLFGILFVKPFFRLWFGRQGDINGVVGLTAAALSNFLGLLLGLISVATYQNYSSLSDNVTREASVVAALYRNFSVYDSPIREELQQAMRVYVRTTIDSDWPIQQRGIVPAGGSDKVTTMYAKLASYEPQRISQQALHAEALREFNNFVEVRRTRLANITGGIPGVLWYVVVVGCGLNFLLFWMFDMRFMVHILLGGIMAFYLGVMIFIIVTLDTPFRGAVSVGPDPLEAVYDSMMKPGMGAK